MMQAEQAKQTDECGSVNSDINHQPIRAVIFDLDGTLLDTAPDFVVAVNQLRAEHRLEALPAPLIRASVSNGARALVKLALDIEETSPEFEPQRQRLLDLYLNHVAVHTTFFPGVDDLLQTLSAHGIAWGIATNKPALYTDALLKALAIQPAPVSIICPDHVKERKPHAESLFLASKHIGCMPTQLIYVGDHKRDIDCGKNAGAITIAAAYGYIEAGDDIALWQADYCVNHAREIWPIVARLIGKHF